MDREQQEPRGRGREAHAEGREAEAHERVSIGAVLTVRRPRRIGGRGRDRARGHAHQRHRASEDGQHAAGDIGRVVVTRRLHQLETTERTIDVIATRVGYQSGGTLRMLLLFDVLLAGNWCIRTDEALVVTDVENARHRPGDDRRVPAEFYETLPKEVVVVESAAALGAALGWRAG